MFHGFVAHDARLGRLVLHRRPVPTWPNLFCLDVYIRAAGLDAGGDADTFISQRELHYGRWEAGAMRTRRVPNACRVIIIYDAARFDMLRHLSCECGARVGRRDAT